MICTRAAANADEVSSGTLGVPGDTVLAHEGEIGVFQDSTRLGHT